VNRELLQKFMVQWRYCIVFYLFWIGQICVVLVDKMHVINYATTKGLYQKKFIHTSSFLDCYVHNVCIPFELTVQNPGKYMYHASVISYIVYVFCTYECLLHALSLLTYFIWFRFINAMVWYKRYGMKFYLVWGLDRYTV